MSSLKEIKNRISSVNSTMKITSAMKMVASAKLRKAQKNCEAFLPYQRKLSGILQNFLFAEENFSSPLFEQRSAENVAIVVVSSNSSLCGAFNSTVIRYFNKLVANGDKNLTIFPVGKKIADVVKKAGFSLDENLDELVAEPQYDKAAKLVDKLVKLFLEKKIDRVEIIYQHFKSAATQQLRHEQFLPFAFEKDDSQAKFSADYIVEPDKKTIINELLPKVLRLKLYSVLLSSVAAEHAARTVAMQVATDNASDLLQELTVQYNKSRQQAITNELLDIIGGAQM